jgi:RNA polymerase sigma-70 factor, ECF subfamily
MTDDPSSFAVHVLQHTNAMLCVAAALVGSADAEDAAQEALVRAWRAWDTLRDVDSIRPWLLRITVNVCRQWRRGNFGRRVRLVEPLLDEDAELLAVLDADPGASANVGALDARAAVNALDEDLRVIVALRYYAGMDATEVGAALGIPPATARTRLKRALTRLRQILAISDEQKVEHSQEGERS